MIFIKFCSILYIKYKRWKFKKKKVDEKILLFFVWLEVMLIYFFLNIYVWNSNIEEVIIINYLKLIIWSIKGKYICFLMLNV